VIAVDGLTVRQGAFALGPVSFEVPAGRYGVLMGRTGSGKTTLLEVIAGLRRPPGGRVLLRGRDVTGLPPADRNLGYVPQDGAVFRTMTVRENLAFALTVRRASSVEIVARVGELAEWLGLTAILDRIAVGLSGGEAQRVALGRALAFRPDVLLLDEPLSSLDEPTRDGLLELLDGLRKTARATVLHVTHSRAEADRLGDVVLRLDATSPAPGPAGPSS
jgi:ABC-type sugar transport system ATPase subunit